ncbi:MAG TPA: hypothetical protein VN436_09565, partial [Holophaga sp.]|nr:hypothetical protein [Holophaga sp.]
VLLVLVFFSISKGKRGVYITPATPALALLAAPSLPDLLVRRWPPRLMRLLAWVLSGLFLAVAAALMASPALAAKVAAVGPHPWLLPLSLGVTTACACLVLWKAPMTSVFAVLALVWFHYGLWGYPLLDGVRSSKLLMAQVAEHVPGRSPLLIVGFREQQLLQGGRPVEHYPYGMKETVQAPLAADWLQQGQDRWVLGRAEFMHATFDTAKGIRLSAEGEDSWTLYRADAILPGHPAGPADIPRFHYQPQE